MKTAQERIEKVVKDLVRVASVKGFASNVTAKRHALRAAESLLRDLKLGVIECQTVLVDDEDDEGEEPW